MVFTTTGRLANTGLPALSGRRGTLDADRLSRPVGAPGTLLATGINDAGAIVGLDDNPNAAPDDQPSPMQMPDDDVGR